MRCVSQRLIDKMYNSETYKQYVEYYDKNHCINIDLLKKLYFDNQDLYIVFLKINVVLYRYDYEELGICTMHNNRNLYVTDIDVILKHYISNYDRCRNAIKCLISHSLVSKSDVSILKQILSRDKEKEIF